MSNDSELLRQYIEERSESAFTELVQGHLNLVYSAAFRETNGDMGLAQDISQAVFTELAGKARRLQNHPSISGWLYRSVRLVAANVRRGEQRRRHREEEAQRVMDAPTAEGCPDRVWQQIRPELDDVLHKLNEAERTAVVLRFLEERSLREVGAILGNGKDAKRKTTRAEVKASARTIISHPVGRLAQAAACKAAEAGAIPARDSISPSIGC